MWQLRVLRYFVDVPLQSRRLVMGGSRDNPALRHSRYRIFGGIGPIVRAAKRHSPAHLLADLHDDIAPQSRGSGTELGSDAIYPISHRHDLHQSNTYDCALADILRNKIRRYVLITEHSGPQTPQTENLHIYK